MYKLKNYLLKTFAGLFFSIFLPLITIASIIILVRIATVTAIVQLNVQEMLTLFIYTLPQVLFFTIPTSFFVAGVMTINKLSNENEIVVLFALGVHPGKIVQILFRSALLLSIVLILTSLFVVPHATQLYDNFIRFKKTNATFNIKASEFGQSFGAWMLYVGEGTKNQQFKDVALYNPNEKNRELLVIADYARIANEDMQLKFKLDIGKSFIYEKDELTQINFDKMQINDTTALRKLYYKSGLDYWKDMNETRYIKESFLLSIMFSLLPILGVTLFLTLGINNSRHQKSFTYLFIFISVSLYVATFTLLANIIDLYAIPATIVLWATSTYWLYKKKVVSRY
ncbi:MAG: LptF/LptG family permease [Thiovulaceae bacterium]|nr:LptF/LptG family permease [Sulfurimonadaceae bacterium]